MRMKCSGQLTDFLAHVLQLDPHLHRLLLARPALLLELVDLVLEHELELLQLLLLAHEVVDALHLLLDGLLALLDLLVVGRPGHATCPSAAARSGPSRP